MPDPPLWWTGRKMAIQELQLYISCRALAGELVTGRHEWLARCGHRSMYGPGWWVEMDRCA